MRILLALLPVLLAGSALATTPPVLEVKVYNFASEKITGRRVTLTLTEAGPVTAGDWLLAGDAVVKTTGTNGIVYFTNVLAGTYRLDISGSPSRSFPFGMIDTNGMVNVASLIGATNTAPTFYTAAQVAALIGNNTTPNVQKLKVNADGSVDATAGRWTNNAYVDLKNYGAVGDGDTDDTDAIMAAFGDAVTLGMPLFLPPGTYKHTTPLVFNAARFKFVGSDMFKTVLRYTGPATSNAVSFVSSPSVDYNLTVEDIGFESDAGQCTNTVLIQRLVHVWFKNVAVRNAQETCLLLRACAMGTFNNISLSANQDPAGWIAPTNCLKITRLSAGYECNSLVFENLIAEGASGDGIVVEAGSGQIKFIAGTSESHGGRGLFIDGTVSPCAAISVDTLDCEGNGADYDLGIVGNIGTTRIVDSLFTKGAWINSGPLSLLTCRVGSILLDTNSTGVDLSGTLYNITGTGTFTNSGVGNNWSFIEDAYTAVKYWLNAPGITINTPTGVGQTTGLSIYNYQPTNGQVSIDLGYGAQWPIVNSRISSLFDPSTRNGTDLWLQTHKHSTTTNDFNTVLYGTYDGKVGIGKTNPAVALDVVGTVSATAFDVGGAIGITTNVNVLVAGGTTNQLQFTKGILTGVSPQ